MARVGQSDAVGRTRQPSRSNRARRSRAYLTLLVPLTTARQAVPSLVNVRTLIRQQQTWAVISYEACRNHQMNADCFDRWRRPC